VDGAIDIMEKYIDENYDESMLSTLAKTYLGVPNMSKWRSIYDDLLKLDPAWPSYYYQMATTYFETQDYDRAAESIRHALEICPSSSHFWSKLGEIQRIQKKEAEAIESYRTALKFYPTDYESRDALREMEGKKSIYDEFETVNVDSLIKHAPAASAYPDEKGLILLDNAQRVVYERGVSESSQEYIVKLFNSRAIDDWKEYSIPYNRYHEELIVDKAVAVKPDGTEIKADIDDNYVVFKQLEENDIIRLKWRIKNHYSGRLSNQFWDSYYFNGFYPVQHVRYSLIAPQDFTFQYGAQNMKSDPVKSNVADGVLYRWSLDSLPAISYEYGMPTLDDVGQILYISSIKDWNYLVDWYNDIAKAKTRTSFEVKEKVHELLKGKESASDEVKMKAIYDFITENIRYSSVAFRQGAYTPQKARDVLVNKIGDCKDVATLCISMLREAGITAHHVLVNTRDEGLNKSILPSIAFNHCIVGVETKQGIKYLDLTANNYPYGSLPSGDVEAFSLLIKPGVAAPEYITRTGVMPRNVEVIDTVEVRADNGIALRGTTSVTGSISAGTREGFRNHSKKEQEKSFLSILSSDFPNVKLLSFETDNLDNLDPRVGYRYTFEVPNHLTDAGTDLKLLKLPWSNPAKNDEALSYEKREYAYEYWPGLDSAVEVISVQLPQGYVPMELPPSVQYKSAIAEYNVKYTVANGRLIARRQLINRKENVSTSEYAEFKSFYNNIVKEDTRQILLKKKGGK
jgi:tetratricopeptide (TPR) repeat protein